jgi:hypothetical protein
MGDHSLLVLLEMLIPFAAFIAFCVWQIISVRKDVARSKAARSEKD